MRTTILLSLMMMIGCPGDDEPVDAEPGR